MKMYPGLGYESLSKIGYTDACIFYNNAIKSLEQEIKLLNTSKKK